MDKVTKLGCGAIVTPLSRILSPKGGVFHGLRATEDTFHGFGEAYFSTVLLGITKGWKRHERMTLNLVVPVGTIEFHLRSCDGYVSDHVRLGEAFYARLTVPPGVWMAFTGVSGSLNLLLNVANIPHDPEEAVNVPLDHFPIED